MQESIALRAMQENPPNSCAMTRGGRKRCPKCGEVRDCDEFARDASKRDGRKSVCKTCNRARAQAYYEANREKVIARVQARNAKVRNTPQPLRRRSQRRYR